MSGQRRHISRRMFLGAGGAAALTSLLSVYGYRFFSRLGSAKGARGKRVVVLGLDGFDPVLAERMMAAGRLPNLSRFRDGGGYRRLGTTIPPQSPVAWASFITGGDPGTHGIFDFIHRDPKQQCVPIFSMAETVATEDGWEVGDYRIPLAFWPFNHSPARTLLRRQGVPFWDHLDEAGVPAWIYDIPSNYPPSRSEHGHQFCLSGMGTPDLLGTYGTYQHFSTRYRQVRHEGGGIRKPLRFTDHRAEALLTGPRNTLLKPERQVDSEVSFRVFRHPRESLARIDLPDATLVLKAGEWSAWQRVRFPISTPSFMPDDEVTGICRFYVQEVWPQFRLYVSPLNIDPADPGDQRISEPPAFGGQIAKELGPFATLGFQEDHKALSNQVFSVEEFEAQAGFVLEERLALLEFALDHYEDGLLFFYFSSTDLQSHMLWWDSEARHPSRTLAQARHGQAVIERLYERMDEIVGAVARRIGPRATLLVMSDHGFCTFRRQFNLNSWLRDNGYLGPRGAETLLAMPHARVVEWGATRAYAIGLNGLYLNLNGREQQGVVLPGTEQVELLEELRARLLAVRDPEDGAPVIAAVHRSDEVYTGPHGALAPDLIIGYHRGYRASWDTTLGSLSTQLIRDNDSAWSADHCMATAELPGVLFANRPIAEPAPTLMNLAPTLLREFGLAIPRRMTNRPLLVETT